MPKVSYSESKPEAHGERGLMDELELVKEICGDCLGCSTKPTSIAQISCGNPLEKYLWRKAQEAKAATPVRGKECPKKATLSYPWCTEECAWWYEGECVEVVKAKAQVAVVNAMEKLGDVIRNRPV